MDNVTTAHCPPGRMDGEGKREIQGKNMSKVADDQCFAFRIWLVTRLGRALPIEPARFAITYATSSFRLKPKSCSPVSSDMRQKVSCTRGPDGCVVRMTLRLRFAVSPNAFHLMSCSLRAKQKLMHQTSRN